MVPRETVSFVFQRVLMFPEIKWKETSELEQVITKTNKDGTTGVRARTALLYL